MARPRRSRVAAIIVAIIRPPLRVFAFLVGGIYKVLFGWWLDPTTQRKNEASLKQDIQNSFPSLFTKCGGQFVPNPVEYPKAFDYVTVSVLAEGVLLEFIRGRGEVRLRVAPESKPSELRDLEEVVRLSGRFQESAQLQKYSALRIFARFLETHFEQIRSEVVSPNWALLGSAR